MSTVDFNIGEALNVTIGDITNQIYSYKLYLDLLNANNEYVNITILETSSKNFTWDISTFKNIMYDLLSTRNSANCRISLETRVNGNWIGTTIKEGVCKVINSNPNIPNFTIVNMQDIEITQLSAGYGPYRDISNFKVKIQKFADIPIKNGAKLVSYTVTSGVGATEQFEILKAEDMLLPKIPGSGDINYAYAYFLDPFGALQEKDLNEGKGDIAITAKDSRGNISVFKRTINITHIYRAPKVIEIEAKRVNGIDKAANLKVSGKCVFPLTIAKYYVYISNPKLRGGENMLGPFDIAQDKILFNEQNGTFSIDTPLQRRFRSRWLYKR